MTAPTGREQESLQAEIAGLRQTLDNLAEMADQGLPVAGVQAEAQERLVALEAQLADAEVSTFDQRDQRIESQINIAHLYQFYQAPPGRAELTEGEFRQVLDDYLDWVVREYGYTRLHGLQTLQQTGALDRPLAQVYTSLAVRHRPAVTSGGDADRDWQPIRMKLDMADLLTLGERIAVVGGAGSGKTTYLAFVAASLAADIQGRQLDVRLKRPESEAPPPVPLLAPLRFWQVYRDECAQVPGLKILHGPDEGSLGAFLLWFLRARYKNFDAAGDFFDRLLRGGRGCLILLDGLDEVVSAAERRTVRDEVDRLLRSQYPGNRCIVTAREAGYRDAPFGGDFLRCDVQPMTKDQIAALVGAWCGQIYPQPRDQQAVSNDLLRVINELNAERAARGQTPLVATPLMVTMVVSVKYSRRELPRERAKLYDACVDVVLKSEYTGREDDAGARRGLVAYGGPPDKKREWLSLLAFQMHRGGRASASLDEAGVRAVLEPAFRERGELALLDRFIAAVRARGGLFEERGERFQFTHLTFQEYLAAQFLARQLPEQTSDFLVDIATDEWWREVLLLTVGSLGAPAPFERRRAFIEALCNVQGSMEAQLTAAELAALGLNDLNDPEPTLLDMARERLITLLNDPTRPQASPAARAAAACTLTLLGDPRDFDELVIVPAGPFLMGSSDVADYAYDDEKPQHRLTLPTFRIGKYPVINEQYLRFARATGRGWASENGDRPDRATCPATDISWYDAEAYCHWLTEVWRDEGKIGFNEIVRLPSEAEWEKAASWEERTDGGEPTKRRYPWGDEWDEERCNTRELNLGDVTPVGVFPDGASAYGCLDMAGNVWEWTRSLWGTDLQEPDFPYRYDFFDGREDPEANGDVRRILRGGSFSATRIDARCTQRNWNHPPIVAWPDHGFRVVVVRD